MSTPLSISHLGICPTKTIPHICKCKGNKNEQRVYLGVASSGRGGFILKSSRERDLEWKPHVALICCPVYYIFWCLYFWQLTRNKGADSTLHVLNPITCMPVQMLTHRANRNKHVLDRSLFCSQLHKQNLECGNSFWKQSWNESHMRTAPRLVLKLRVSFLKKLCLHASIHVYPERLGIVAFWQFVNETVIWFCMVSLYGSLKIQKFWPGQQYRPPHCRL